MKILTLASNVLVSNCALKRVYMTVDLSHIVKELKIVSTIGEGK